MIWYKSKEVSKEMESRKLAEREIRLSAIASASFELRGNVPSSGVLVARRGYEEQLKEEIIRKINPEKLKRLDSGEYYFFGPVEHGEEIEEVLRNERICEEGIAFTRNRVVGTNNKNLGLADGKRVYVSLIANEPIHRVINIVRAAKDFAYWVEVSHVDANGTSDALAVSLEFEEARWGEMEIFSQSFRFLFV